MTIRKIALLFGMAWLLAACSGDPLPQDEDGSETGEEETLVEEAEQTNVSYLPLMTVERYKEWSGFDEDNVFRTYGRSPFVSYYTINPVNATNLEPIETATVEDFSILQDGIPINPKVSFPLLQKIIGNQVALRTAIVINTSEAMNGYGVNQSALISEIKNYVTAAKSSSNYFIRNQEFTVWAVDGITVEETSNATAVEADVLSALDTLNTNWTNGDYRPNGANHTYDGVIEAIGRFIGSSEFSVALDYRDSGPVDNDLFDYVTPDFIQATNIIVFSAGMGDPGKSGEDDFKRALESQSTFVYSQDAEPSGATTETKSLPKPLIYAVPEGQPKDDILNGLAYEVIEYAGQTYSFAEEIIDAQINSIQEKNALTNQHVLRWASAIRSGDAHKSEVKTRTGDGAYGYSLTVDYDFGDPGFANEMPDPQVEITGANNEYLATNDVANAGAPYDSATTYANLISTFYPATRWTNQEFSASDYTWSYTPSGSMVENSDGSVSIASSATFPITLTLTNSNITHDGVTISDDFVLTIQETNQ